jgi:hypothetical protein
MMWDNKGLYDMARKKVVEVTVPSILAVDLGNAYCNLAADGGIVADWRSIQGRVSDANRMRDLPFDHIIGLGDAWYVFGEAAYTYAPRSLEDFPTTERYTTAWYRRLFAYALHRAYGLRLAEGPFYPKAIVSIPAREFANTRRTEQVRDNLTGPYIIHNTLGSTLQVVMNKEALTIVPEGAGTFFYMLDKHSQNGRSSYAQGTWLVLDLGYLTGDVVGFIDGEYIPDMATSDSQAGMRYVAQRVADFVRSEGGPDIPAEHYDPQLGCDSVIINGLAYNIQKERDDARAALAERIVRFITRIAAGQNLSGILLTGGGAEVMGDLLNLKKLPPLTRVPNPRRANVDGAYSLLRSA